MFAISKLYHSYKNILHDNKDAKKIKKSNSIANINYIENKKISKNPSFIMIDTDSITQASFIGIDEMFSICVICNSKFPKNCNTVCCYKCYKLSKKNIDGFSIKCKNCERSFITKNLFTDYCSDECFTPFNI